MLKRSHDNQIAPGVWQILYGHLKENEGVEAGIRREVTEETGLAAERISSVNETLIFYEKNEGTINIVPVFAIVVDENCKIKLNNEHSSFLWVGLKKAEKMLSWNS